MYELQSLQDDQGNESVASLLGSLKLIVDGAAKGKLGIAGIGGVCCKAKREILDAFCKSAGVKDSNEVEFLAILEALRIHSFSPREVLVLEGDSSNAIAWVVNLDKGHENLSTF